MPEAVESAIQVSSAIWGEAQLRKATISRTRSSGARWRPAEVAGSGRAGRARLESVSAHPLAHAHPAAWPPLSAAIPRRPTRSASRTPLQPSAALP